MTGGAGNVRKERFRGTLQGGALEGLFPTDEAETRGCGELVLGAHRGTHGWRKGREMQEEVGWCWVTGLIRPRGGCGFSTGRFLRKAGWRCARARLGAVVGSPGLPFSRRGPALQTRAPEDLERGGADQRRVTSGHLPHRALGEVGFRFGGCFAALPVVPSLEVQACLCRMRADGACFLCREFPGRPVRAPREGLPMSFLPGSLCLEGHCFVLGPSGFVWVHREPRGCLALTCARPWFVWL